MKSLIWIKRVLANLALYLWMLLVDLAERLALELSIIFDRLVARTRVAQELAEAYERSESNLIAALDELQRLAGVDTDYREMRNALAYINDLVTTEPDRLDLGQAENARIVVERVGAEVMKHRKLKERLANGK